MQKAIFDYHLKPWEIYGGKRPFFVKYANMIEDVINDFKLVPMKEQSLFPALKISQMKTETAREAMIQFDPDIFGGKRFAHMHYQGDVYMMNQEQWRSFTSRVKDDLINKLHDSNTISIEQIQDLSDVIDGIG